ncbi:MAG: hypothetical protein ACI8UD_004378, partial [Planctomycetota bacterium]
MLDRGRWLVVFHGVRRRLGGGRLNCWRFVC